MRRVLVVSPHFPPANTVDMHRVRMTVGRYRENGWEPTVLCVRPELTGRPTEPGLAGTLPRDIARVETGAISPTVARLLGLNTIGLRAWPAMRNGVIGLSQRGLDEALVALTLVDPSIRLAVQGRQAMDGGERLSRRISELSLDGRVDILPPYSAGHAIEEASSHMVGLCLERRGPLNHYTVSNKLFDYMMAGLAVVVSDLPSLRTIVERAKGGLLFEPGSAASLAKQIESLHRDRGQLQLFSQNARRYALAEGNDEVDVARLKAALIELIS